MKHYPPHIELEHSIEPDDFTNLCAANYTLLFGQAAKMLSANDIVDAYKDFKKLRDEHPDKKISCSFLRNKDGLNQMEIKVFLEP